MITQSDLVDSDQITLVGMEIEDLIRPTRFAGAPVVAVSAVTGQGMDELKVTIDRVLKTAQPRRDTGKPRLPIDRVFTISGSGTVVTGTLEDGSLALGQEVEILPPALSSRIKSLQAHKSKLNAIGPGNRVAVNLVGLSLAEIKRGQVLTTPGWLAPTKLIDARLKLLAQPDRPLRHNTEVALHTGSAEVTARVRVLEKKEALPGETTWVQFILDEPLAVVNGDHYVIRSPMDTLGGGIILDAHPEERYRRFRPEIIENFKTRSEGKIEKTLLTILKSKPPLEPDKLISESGLNEELALSDIETLLQQGTAVMVGEGKNALLYPESDWKQTVENILSLVRDYQQQFPIRPGIPKAEINNKIKLGKHFQDIMQKLISQDLVVEESSLVHLPGFQIKISPAQQVQIDTYQKQLNLNPYSPTAGISLDTDLLNLLVYRGEVVKTASGTVFSAAAFNEMVLKITNHLKQNGKITVAEARDLLGSSRKYVLALLEQMDEMKLTKRVGDERVAGENNKA